MATKSSSSSSNVTLMNSSSCKLRFAHNFLRSLSKIKSRKPIVSDQSVSELRKRSRRIKLAAYSSMARAVGPRKAWARAILFKLKTRARVPKFAGNRANSGSQLRTLRRLVPGGEAMDCCSLLQETAHYIHCLTTQVQLMKAIAERNT